MARNSRYPLKKAEAPGPAPDPAARLAYLAAEAVLAAVGRPADMLRVESRPAGDAAFRVNLVRESAGVVTRRDSFYVRLAADGGLLSSDPGLTRRFPE